MSDAQRRGLSNQKLLEGDINTIKGFEDLIGGPFLSKGIKVAFVSPLRLSQVNHFHHRM